VIGRSRRLRELEVKRELPLVRPFSLVPMSQLIHRRVQAHEIVEEHDAEAYELRLPKRTSLVLMLVCNLLLQVRSGCQRAGL
jgi:hypothetical protein